MQGRGHELSLLCPPESRIFEEASAYGIRAIALPIGRKNLTGLLAMRRWLRRDGIGVDVINTHSSTDTWLAGLSLSGLGNGPVLVRTRHISAPVPRGPATRWLYRSASRFVITTGQSLRHDLIERLDLDPERVVSIPTGIDFDRYGPATPSERQVARERLRLPADAFVVGIVATLRSWKGHRYMIEALAKLRDDRALPGLRMVIVGDGPQRTALEEQAASLGLSDRIIFTGNQTDVVPWLHAFDVFVLPSYANEGVPQALLQAMGCALPAITTDAGAIGEIARHEETALVVRQEDAGAIAAAIARLRSDPTLAARLGSQARTLVVATHGLEGMLDQMEQIFLAAARHPSQSDPNPV